MKKIITLSLALLATVGANAQSKLSSDITNMLNSVEQQIAEAQQQNRSNSLDQSAVSSCPVDTAAIQENLVVSFNADGTVRTVDVIATLAEGAICPTAILEAKGIRVKDQVRKFVFLEVPTEQLTFLETLEEFVSLTENPVYHPMTDKSRSVINVSNINGIDSESYTFDIPYTGKGVVVGIVDAGMDYNHIAFKDSKGNTRVKKVVDYRNNGSATIATTPEAIAQLTTDGNTDKDKSHGTHVASCAVGSIIDAIVDYDGSLVDYDGSLPNIVGAGSRKLGGMAPEADIVLCGTYSLTGEHITKSVDEIVKTAKELNEPCVINFSFGTTGTSMYGGWHDGSTQTNSLINEYANEGVIFCMSTANDAINNWTVDKTIPAGGELKFIPRKDIAIASTSRAYIPQQTILINLPQCTNTQALSYELEAVDSITGAVTTLADTPLRNTNGNTIIPSVTFTQSSSHHNWVTGTLSLTKCYFADNSKFLVIKLKNKTASDLRVYAMSSLKSDNLAYTDFPNYEYDKGTADMSINHACSADNLISVGAYTIEPKVRGYKGTSYSLDPRSTLYKQMGGPNSTAGYSSYGRDDFGKAHPDVIAPGTFLVAAYNRYDTSNATVTDKSTWIEQYICAYLTDNSGNNHLFYRNQGTSMAAPITAGVIALWLQAYPKLTAENVRTVIQQTSRTSVNGEVINISAGSTDQNKLQLGYGLIDAEAGIQYIKDHFPTAIAGVKANESSTPAIIKKFVGGAIVVEKDGKLYNASGQRVK
jgi:subtilisin family serine protease